MFLFRSQQYERVAWRREDSSATHQYERINVANRYDSISLSAVLVGLMTGLTRNLKNRKPHMPSKMVT